MVQITFIEHGGACRIVEADIGLTLMQVATGHGLRGLIAECGGARVCGTCHCYVEEPSAGAAGLPCDDEKMMVEFSEHHRPNSRLSCQIRVSDALDGLVVRFPPSQP